MDQYSHKMRHGNQLPMYFFYFQTVYSSMLLFSFYWGHKGFYKMRTRKGNLCQNFARMHFIIQFPIPSIASFQCTLFDWTFHCIQSHWIDLIMVESQFCSDVPSTRPAWSKCQASIGKCSTISECREVLGLKWFIPTKRIVVVWKYCRMERKKRRSLPKMDIEKVWIKTFSNSELWCMYCNVFLPGSNTIVPISWYLFCVVWFLMSH